MKLKKLIACTLAACTLLAGCKDNNKNGDESSSRDKSESAESSGNSSTTSEEVNSMITSNKPKEIDGFLGNTVEVAPKAGDLIATFEIEGFGTIKAVLFPEAAPMGVENFQKLADAGYYKGLTIHRVIKDFMFQGGSLNGDGTGGDAMVSDDAGDGEFGIETAQNARHFYGALCYANAGGRNSTQFYIVNNKSDTDITEYDFDSYKSTVEQINAIINSAREQGISDEDMRYALYYTYGQDLLSQGQSCQNVLDWLADAPKDIAERYKEKGGTPSLDGGYTVFGQVYEGFDVIDAISAVEVEDNGSGEKSSPVQEIIIKDVTVTEFAG